jgi:hypothetical protein
VQHISREQLTERWRSARARFLKDLDEAGDDGAKRALAEQRLALEEEASLEAFNQRTAAFRLFDSIPVLGKPVTIILDHLEKGIAVHGVILGLIRGGLMGVVLAAMLFAVSETVVAVHKVWGNWIELHYIAPAISEQRADTIEESTRTTIEEFVHRGAVVAAKQNVPYYAPAHLDPASLDGFGDVTIDDVLRGDPGVFKREPGILDKRILIVPFFRHFREKKSIVPGMSRAAHHDLVTITDPDTRAEYALVAIDEHGLLIPVAAYKAAGLPVSEAITSEKQDEENDVRS